ncbi:MAG: prepilin-type N-terminal cleavage/methylation domain-containing protein [Desulfotomaculaceae bacterium]
MKLTRNERGFTLIELMVVLIIIGILAAIAIPVMSKQTDKAKVKRAVGELKSMKTIVDIYMNDTGVNITGVAPLATADATNGIKAVLQINGVTDAGLIDPWGNGYVYARGVSPFKTYTLFSTGSDATVTEDEIKVTETLNPTEKSTVARAAGDITISTNAITP